MAADAPAAAFEILSQLAGGHTDMRGDDDCAQERIFQALGHVAPSRHRALAARYPEPGGDVGLLDAILSLSAHELEAAQRGDGDPLLNA